MEKIIKCKDKSQIPALIEKYGLDRRYRYSSWNGELITTHKFTLPCSGCNDVMIDDTRGDGCEDCGYTGKSVQAVPCPVFVPEKKPARKPRK